jgi:hypothetical protein
LQVSNWNVEREARQVYNLPTLDNVAREGMQSRYRETFRMTVPNEVQRKPGSNCGDRLVRAGDYEGLGDLIDYPCRTGLPADVIDDAVRRLRANEALIPLLRLRIVWPGRSATPWHGAFRCATACRDRQ